MQPEHGPGSRLTFKSGSGNGRVQISTNSGDVSLSTISGTVKIEEGTQSRVHFGLQETVGLGLLGLSAGSDGARNVSYL